MVKLTVYALFLTMLQACKHSCVPAFVNPVFIGFPSGDLDTMIVRAYQTNSNYLNLVDTLLIVKGGTGIYTESHDTVIAFINVNIPQQPIHSGYDWQIYIPKLNRIFTLTDIVDVPREGLSRLCYDGISSFKLNGQEVVPQVVSTGVWYTSGYFAYINY